MDTLIIILLSVVIILLITNIILTLKNRSSKNNFSELSALKEDSDRAFRGLKEDINSSIQNNMGVFGDFILERINQTGKSQLDINEIHNLKLGEIDHHLRQSLELSQNNLHTSMQRLENRLSSFSSESEQKLENIRQSVEKSLFNLQQDNNIRLTEMKNIVDEKLQKTINDRMTQSFMLVNERLEQVYIGLGQMQSLASGVGDLKKILSNVKTRGILGEIQLEAILKEILSPAQFVYNFECVSGSGNRVEFAVKMPSVSGESIYLPIDSKFPLDKYSALKEAYDNADKSQIDLCVKELLTTIRKEAKDISDKYINPPVTTDFAIMFIPFEGLYSEIVNRGMIEELQNKYKINIAGPSTMAALLNSLQLGFRSFAIHKRSQEVWNVLGEVKTEFEKFSSILVAAQKKINQANDEIDKLVGTRTRQMLKILNNVGNEDESE